MLSFPILKNTEVLVGFCASGSKPTQVNLRGYYRSIRLSQHRHERGEEYTDILRVLLFVPVWGVIPFWTHFPVSPAT